ncbi:hypothetical protein PMAYCL1PPCAC_19620, partial [Pristionchus mayeri]
NQNLLERTTLNSSHNLVHLDEIIRVIYDSEKIGDHRLKALSEVLRRLDEAIQMNSNSIVLRSGRS